ncbi:HAD hydrolase-like protein [archaeon]|jgi:5'-nucleotidase|nr:HAD hydrolase-like protein [archaeon]MBT4646824.1 HAD hydrolase-like protein [archaeon]MBT7392479.1 HAD hydrolase-like protein [archaeon]
MISTYLFDLDDTIIDASIYTKMYQPIINKLAEQISAIELQKIINEIKKETKKSRVDTYELCEKLNCTEFYYDLLEQYIEEYGKLKFDIVSVFKKIKNNGKKIGIVSNSKEKTINLFLKYFNLNQYVELIISGNKSDPDFWQTMIIKYKFDKQTTLLIDNDDDVIELAKASGLKALKIKHDSIQNFNL